MLGKFGEVMQGRGVGMQLITSILAKYSSSSDQEILTILPAG